MVMLRSIFGFEAHIKNTVFTCPKGYQIEANRWLLSALQDMGVVCSPCKKGTFNNLDKSPSIQTVHYLFMEKDKSLSNEAIKNMYLAAIGGGRRTRLYKNRYKINNRKCKRCPFGGICDDITIKSRDNFYGFVRSTEDGTTVDFVPCLEKYCCSKESNQRCKTIKTCGAHRTGRMCGKCKENFFVSYFSNECQPSESCTTGQVRFWIIYLTTNFLTALVLLFAKTFIAMGASIYQTIKQACCQLVTFTLTCKRSRRISSLQPIGEGDSEIELNDLKKKRKKKPKRTRQASGGDNK